jgi:NTP pyrophosphatase (non-canonical NTP hydrolase)
MKTCPTAGNDIGLEEKKTDWASTLPRFDTEAKPLDGPLPSKPEWFLKNLNIAAHLVYCDNFKKGFWDDDRSNAECIALIHSELSEALEADRKDLMDDKLPHRDGLTCELADTIIRVLDLAGARDLDLAGAICEKLEYNRGRPRKHGKKY